MDPKNFHDFEGAKKEWKSFADIAISAIRRADKDYDNKIVRYLVYGGPMAPWYGEKYDNMRELGIKVEAVALCEIFYGEDMYADVYNAYMAHKHFPGIHFPSLIHCDCDPKHETEFSLERREQIKKEGLF